jgi:putative transposase
MRILILEAINIAVKDGARFFKACEAINICQRRVRRWKNCASDQRKGGYRAKSQKLSDIEKGEIIENFSQHEYEGIPIRVVHARLMDKGIYIASPASCIRVLGALCNKKATDAVKHINRVKPELKTTGPNQVWCWDVTWLPSNIRGKYFYLYLIIDMYSRYIVDFEVYSTEDSQLAKNLFARALQHQNIDENSQLVVHADNGQMMRSVTLKELFHLLSVKASHSRPHTSNDNAYAESIFATMKGRVLYPSEFRTLDASREFCKHFVEWYNFEHKHSEIAYLSPYEVHINIHDKVLKERNNLLHQNRIQHPARHSKNNGKIYAIPKIVELKHTVSLKSTI